MIDCLDKRTLIVTGRQDEISRRALAQQSVSVIRPRGSDNQAMLKTSNRGTSPRRKTINKRRYQQIHRSQPIRCGFCRQRPLIHKRYEPADLPKYLPVFADVQDDELILHSCGPTKCGPHPIGQTTGVSISEDSQDQCIWRDPQICSRGFPG